MKYKGESDNKDVWISFAQFKNKVLILILKSLVLCKI